MSGLGIDFGQACKPQYGHDGSSRPSTRQQRPEQQKKRTTGAAAAPPTATAASLASKERNAALPKKSSFSRLRRLTTTHNERLEARRVRIASGEPGILGHGAYTDEDFLSPSSVTYSSSSEDVVIRRNPPASLSAAILSFAGSPSDHSAGDSALSYEEENSSPGTETYVTSFSSGSNGRGRSKTLKKYASQSQLSRSGTTRVTQMKGPPPANSKAVSRSLSSTSLSAAYKSDSGSSLGRSSEIPRSGSRNDSMRGQFRGYGRGGARASRGAIAASEAAPHPEKPPGQSTTSTPPDLASRISVQPGPRPASLRSVASISTSENSSVVSRPCSDGPSLLSRIAMDDSDSPPVASLHADIRADDASSPIRPQASSVATPVSSIPLAVGGSAEVAERPKQWRVGSFYAPNGEETGRIDTHGRVSRDVSRNPTVLSKPSTASISTPSSGDRQSSRSRANSAGAPRARLMTSPPQPMCDAATSAMPRPRQQGTEGTAQAASEGAPDSNIRTLSMRSARGLRGLEGAERGEAMVTYDRLSRAFESGLAIMPGNVETADQQSLLASTQINYSEDTETEARAGLRMSTSVSQGGLTAGGVAHGDSVVSYAPCTRPRRSLSEAAASTVMLDRQGTLLSTGANPIRRSKELNRLLGNSGRKLPASAAAVSELTGSEGDKGKMAKLQRSNAVGSNAAPPAALEQGKASKARVEVDLVLESDLVVEGGTMKGRMQIKLRKGVDKEGAVMLAQPKIRVVGFEELLNDDSRHIFYHHASVIDGDRSSGGPSEPYYLHGSPTFSSPEARGHSSLPCYESLPDVEGFAIGKEGVHSIPFSLDLPIAKGAKGSYRGKNAVVRYIVIGSVKLKSAGGSNRSITHFYRHVELYPYLNPAIVLSNTPRPIQASTSKGLFLGGSGKVHLTASLHRTTWVAGQRVYVNVAVQNDTNKKINSMTLALIRTVTLYRPRPELDMAKRSDLDGYYDPDACQTSTTRKKISEEKLEMGQKGSKGVVTAKGWWTGVEAGGSVDFSHYTTLPSDALSISRGRHVEVTYAIKVSVGSSLSSDVLVELPLRVVNFVSLDPPPLRGKSLSATSPVGLKAGADRIKSWTQLGGGGSGVGGVHAGADPMIAKVKSIEALRSPSKAELSLHHGDRSSLATAQQQRRTADESELERSKRLQHQKSLDFINHAIRSATARRGATSSTESSPLGLGIAIADEPAAVDASSGSQRRHAGSEAPAAMQLPMSHDPAAVSSGTASSIGPIHPSCLPYNRESLASIQAYRIVPKLRVTNAVSADEAGDDFGDDDYSDPDRTLGLNDESVDEVDLVIGSTKTNRENSPNFRDVQYSRANDPELSFDESAIFDDDSDEDEEEAEEEERHAALMREQDGDAFEVDEQDEDDCMAMIPEAEDEADTSHTQMDSWRAEREEIEENWETDNQEDVAEVSQLMQVIPQIQPATAEYDIEEEYRDVASPSPVVVPRARHVPEPPIVESRAHPLPEEPISASKPSVLPEPPERAIDAPVAKPGSSITKPAVVNAVPCAARSPYGGRPTPPTAHVHPVKTSPTKMEPASSTAPLRLRARPSSPAKSTTPASPQKSTLKTKSSFTFATGQNPLKTSKETPKLNGIPSTSSATAASSTSPVLRAKVSQDQIAKPSILPVRTSEERPGASTPKVEAAKAENVPRKRGGTSTRKRSKPGTASKRGKEGGATSGSDTPSDTTASSPATSAGAETPESICGDLPRFAPTGNSARAGLSVVNRDRDDMDSVADKVEPSPQSDRLSILPRSISSRGEMLGRPDKVDGMQMKHFASTTDIFDGGSIRRSGSTHNLRDSSIVVPSVRNKIAMLEIRNQALKDFTAGNGSGDAVNRTPTNRGGAVMLSGTSTPTNSGTPGRVAQLAASAEKARQMSLSATSLLRLTRKESSASVASSSDASSIAQPDYLRRSTSIVSFKAPMLRSVQQ